MKTPEELTGKVKRSGYLWAVSWTVLLLATSPSATAQTAPEAEQRKAELEAE